MSKIVDVLGDTIIFVTLIPVITGIIVGANVTGTVKVVLAIVDVLLVIGFIVQIMKSVGLSKGR